MKGGHLATLKGICVVFTAAMFMLYACRKQDHIIEMPVKDEQSEVTAGRFFSSYQPANPSVKAVQKYLAALDIKHGFSERFIDQVGFPRWDKSLVYSTAGNISVESSGGPATVVYIPFVREGQLFVNSTIIIRMSASDTDYQVIGNWQYSAYGFDDGGMERWDARDIFNIFARLDKSVFGYSSYKIKDGRIFGHPYETKLTVTDVQGNGPGTEDYILTCTSKTVCVTASPSTNGIQTDTQCTTSTECFLIYVGGGGGGGNNPPGGGSGGGGNGGGGSGGPLPPNPCPYTEGITLDSTSSNPCDTSGWVPQQPNNNPCDKVDSLTSNAGFQLVMTNLDIATADSAEHGVYYTQNPAGVFTAITAVHGNNNDPFINIDVTYSIHGYLHTHYSGGLSVFSPADIRAIARLYQEGRIANVGLFTSGVVTANGTQYLLKIDNEAAFAAFAAQILNPDRFEQVEGEFTVLFGVRPENTNTLNEIRFLNFLQNVLKMGTGLKLFRGNETFTTWEPVRFDPSNNTVVAAPCN